MPVKNPLSGAWHEQWLVYVKLTDIDPDLAEAFVTDGVSSTAYESTGAEYYFTKSGQIDWVKLATLKFHQSYFRHETEPQETLRTIAGVPMVKLNNKSWYENMLPKAADSTVPTNDASDLYKHLQDFAMLQQMSMVEETFESYVAKYGGKIAKAVEGDPEILAFSREWKTPSTMVDPTTGTPSAAWIFENTFDLGKSKPKRFNEPGFILGFQTVRPKMYEAGLKSSMVGNMWGFSDWFPIYTIPDPTAGIKSIDSDDAIFEAATRTDLGEIELIYDHRDILSNGETFINDYDPPFDLPLTNSLLLEDASTPEDNRGEYPVVADINLLFKDGVATKCYYDGMAFATISGHVRNDTPLR